MPILVLTGMPGSGKSLRAARLTIDMLEQNYRWSLSKKNPKAPCDPRPLYTNIRLSKNVEQTYGLGTGIRYWENTSELVALRDCDLVWDELSADLDSHDHASISRELKRFFAQHRKRRVRILGITQDFEDVDISFRRKTDQLERLHKLIGSSDPSANMPQVKRVWGFTLVRELDPRLYDKPDGQGADIKQPLNIPKIIFWSKKDVDIYDSYAEISRGTPPPLRHEVRYCEFAHDPDEPCDHKATRHL